MILARTGRVLFNGLTVVSLIVFLASVVMWVRSYWRIDWVTYYDGDASGHEIWGGGIASVTGRFTWHASRSRMWPPTFSHVPRREVTYSVQRVKDRGVHPIADGGTGVLGFAWIRKGQAPTALKSGGRYLQMVVPWWSIVVVSAVLPGIVIRRRVRKTWRKRKGLCLNCGYDLRGSAERCPECGLMIV